MKRNSISELLRVRDRSKILLFLAGFLVAVVIFQFVVVKNPKESKAETLDMCYAKMVGRDIIISNNTYFYRAWSGMAWTYSTPVAFGATDDLVIDNCEVIAEGVNLFKNVTIRNSGVLTHDPLDYSEGTVSNKQINIVASGDIVLESGGKIDVMGKGYRGGRARDRNGLCDKNGTTVENGFGPGGGGATSGGWPSSPAGGGGYGARGGESTGGLAYENPTAPTTLELGSGGGSSFAKSTTGFSTDWTCANGGNGGGRVYLLAQGSIKILSSASKIVANGSDGAAWASDGEDPTKARAGGGAGGSIYIRAPKLEFPSTGATSSQSIGGQAGGGDATITYINTFPNASVNIFADGGNGVTNDGGGTGGGGGGGRIVIVQISPQNATIKKQLFAQERPKNTVNTTFNPYALQLDDKIQVALRVTNLTLGQSVTIKDEVLRIPGSSETCRVEDVAEIGVITAEITLDTKSYNVASPPYVLWTFTPLTTLSPNSVDLYYYCRVDTHS